MRSNGSDIGREKEKKIGEKKKKKRKRKKKCTILQLTSIYTTLDTDPHCTHSHYIPKIPTLF
jgi:hypothetical protein